MKKILLLFLLLTLKVSYSQEIRFNKKLDQFCKNSVKESVTIPNERKAILDEIASQLYKKKYIVFTCQTNSRRTQLLQTWAQTSFYYFGLHNKFAFSIGDTITDTYPEVAHVLEESGFSYSELGNAPPRGYIISISDEYQGNIILSKKNLGTIDTVKGIVVSICFTGEKSNVAANIKHISLPYQSPTLFEKTSQEKEKYGDLNKQIAVEMLYLAKKTKELIINSEDSPK